MNLKQIDIREINIKNLKHSILNVEEQLIELMVFKRMNPYLDDFLSKRESEIKKHKQDLELKLLDELDGE
jgi:hypothetical protein